VYEPDLTEGSSESFAWCALATKLIA